MSLARPLFFHIGVHRTGTTYLQTQIFPRLDGIEFIDPKTRPGGEELKNYAALARPELRARLAAETDVPLLVSDESLLRAGWGEHSQTRLSQLAGLFPGARVLIAFRRHDSWLRSLYSRYLLRNGLRRLHGFFDVSSDDRGVVRRVELQWMRVLAEVRDTVDDAPFVFLHEELTENLHGLLADLSEFVGAPAPDAREMSRERVRASPPESEQWRQLVRNRMGGRLGLGGMRATCRESGFAELMGTLSGSLAPRGYDARVRAAFDDDWSELIAYLRANRQNFSLGQ